MARANQSAIAKESMMMQCLSVRLRAVGVSALLALTPVAAFAAPVAIDGFVFDSSAFPTAAQHISGGPPTLSFATTGNINTDLLMAADSDLASYIFGTPVTFNLTFGNAPVVNAAGPDLVIFELGTPDTLGLRVDPGTGFTAQIAYNTSATGTVVGQFMLNAAAIDLSDFGVPLGGLVPLFQLNNASTGTTVSSSIVAVGALNTGAQPPPTVPEPASLLLLGGGLVGLLARKQPR